MGTRLPYGATTEPAVKLEQQQKHIVIWLALLHHGVECHTCRQPQYGRSAEQRQLDVTQIAQGRNFFVEWHHVIDPPDYSGYSSRATYATAHPERFFGAIMCTAPCARDGVPFGTLDQLAVELPKCAPVHAKLQLGMPTTCHDLAPEHRARSCRRTAGGAVDARTAREGAPLARR